MIVIEGVVGVGKSSLMRIIAENDYEAFEEPVVDNPILDKFYYDRERYAFPLQVFFLNKRFERFVCIAQNMYFCVLEKTYLFEKDQNTFPFSYIIFFNHIPSFKLIYSLHCPHCVCYAASHLV